MSGRVALVTGGSGGIGTAIARRLHESGYQVAVSYYKGGNVDAITGWLAEQKQAGFEFTPAFGDVADFESAAMILYEVQQKLGPIDVLVNNAGITRDSTLKKMSPDQWQDVINTNLNSLFNVTRNAINSMIERKFGRIINISSINGQKGQFGQANYSASKAGIHGFTKAVAQEVASKNITVNTIAPGYVRTKMVEDVPEKILESIIKQIPVGRLGEPEEIAALVEFLAGDKASYITGAEFAINGGQHMC